jgi:hypothetical protein
VVTRTENKFKRVTYTFTEEEFKQALGITDPEHLLQVVSSFNQKVTVHLMHKED